MGHQPLSLAASAAALRKSGHTVACHDLAFGTLEPDDLKGVQLAALSVPMHTAARLGLSLARRIRALEPQIHITFFGLYAVPMRSLVLRDGIADSVVEGEPEPGLCSVAFALSQGTEVPASLQSFERQEFLLPDRRGLPSLDGYARLSDRGGMRLAGYVEASRGCAHTCSHCPITPVYGGRLRLVGADVVLADIENQVALGAEHITFGDPDFLNAVPHSLAICSELKRRVPGVSFDFTAKIEHLVEYENVLPEFQHYGCLFVTSAFESTNDAMLARLEKGHTRSDMERVLGNSEKLGLTVRPTWVAFMPWTTGKDYLDFLEFIENHDLVDHVQPVQLSLRLLLPPGSPLIEATERDGLLGELDAGSLTYHWHYRDERMDALQREIADVVEEAAEAHDHTADANLTTFNRVKKIAFNRINGVEPDPAARRRSRVVPGLTEDWFC